MKMVKARKTHYQRSTESINIEKDVVNFSAHLPWTSSKRGIELCWK